MVSVIVTSSLHHGVWLRDEKREFVRDTRYEIRELIGFKLSTNVHIDLIIQSEIDWILSSEGQTFLCRLRVGLIESVKPRNKAAVCSRHRYSYDIWSWLRSTVNRELWTVVIRSHRSSDIQAVEFSEEYCRCWSRRHRQDRCVRRCLVVVSYSIRTSNVQVTSTVDWDCVFKSVRFFLFFFLVRSHCQI